MKLPFGEYKGLELTSIKSKDVSKFLNNLTDLMDSAVYGHDNAKKQIVNLMAQQIRNPSCQGSVIALYGPPGTGKTELIKKGIAKAMDKPFIFISLGGAQDSSFLDGHSFTYEGSIYGRIAQALIDAKCMNPIIYFDELDKVSEGHKGDEIINLLIHLIDPVQNKLFRDKYFYDIDLDLSKVTFIF
jgi:ATP-dependent Lon protease